jgi:hypothetical protein
MIARRSASKITDEADAICEISTDLIFMPAILSHSVRDRPDGRKKIVD